MKNNTEIKKIATEAGLSLRQLAIRFDIPSRTMDAWGMGERKPPQYVCQMMRECLGITKQNK